MEPESVRFVDGHKFMWDGLVYDTEVEAQAKAQEYAARGFEVKPFQQEGEYLVYTRRAVTEVVVEGAPPV